MRQNANMSPRSNGWRGSPDGDCRQPSGKNQSHARLGCDVCLRGPGGLLQFLVHPAASIFRGARGCVQASRWVIRVVRGAHEREVASTSKNFCRLIIARSRVSWLTSIDQNRPNILLGSESFALDRGGVSRVGRLLSHVLTDAGKDYSLLSLNESKIESDLGKTFSPAPAAGCDSPRRFGNRTTATRISCTPSRHRAGALQSRESAAPLRRLGSRNRSLGQCASRLSSLGELRRHDLHPDLFHAVSRGVDQQGLRPRRSLLAGNDGGRRARAGEIRWRADGSGGRPSRGRTLQGARPTHRLLAKVASAVKGARLVIVGAGPDASRLRKLAAESPAKESIEFLGFVPEDIWPRCGGARMCSRCPSRGEGFGLVYIEAMRYGVPVIASIHDAGQEVNVDGETGYNVSLDRPGELGDRLVELLSCPSLMRQMGAAGRLRWHELFRFSAFKRRFLPIVDAFLERGQWNWAASAEQALSLSAREARPRTKLSASSAARIDSLRPKANNY